MDDDLTLRLVEEFAEALLLVAIEALQREDGPATRAPAITAAQQGLVTARARLASSLETPTQLTALAIQARLSADEAEVFAFLLGTELDLARQQVLAVLQGPRATDHPTLATLRRLFPAPHAGVMAVAPDAPLRRAALVEVDEHGPWGAHVVRISPNVTWAFLGDVAIDPAVPLGTTFAANARPVSGDAVCLAVSGGDAVSRRVRLSAELPVRAVMVVPIPATAREWSAVVREATLRAIGVVVELGDRVVSRELAAWIDRADHLSIGLSSTEPVPDDTLPERLTVRS